MEWRVPQCPMSCLVSGYRYYGVDGFVVESGADGRFYGFSFTSVVMKGLAEVMGVWSSRMQGYDCCRCLVCRNVPIWLNFEKNMLMSDWYSSICIECVFIVRLVL